MLTVQPQKQRRARRRRWPDLSPFDLRNPIDVGNAHALLVASGLAEDSYDGLERVALAACMARRLAKNNLGGYFRIILERGFSTFGPADLDRHAAKSILREIESG